MPRLELFHSRYRDESTGKWRHARYRAERHVIAARHAEREVIGLPEIREVDPNARAFSPHRTLVTRSHLPAGEPPPDNPPQPEKEPDKDPPVKEPPETDPPVEEPPGEDPATPTGIERFLLLVFLRRYITYCARRRRFAAMNGAARLFAEVRAPG